MNELLIGTVGSILAAIIISACIRVYFGWRNWPGCKILFRIVREFTKAGGINFFSSRQSYIKYKDHGTASSYISKTKSNLIYVGF